MRKTKATNNKKQQEPPQNSQIKKDINDKLSQRIRDKMDQQQKEFFLREKLKAIKEELGEIEDNPNDLQKYIQRLDNEPFPEVIKQRVKSEISRVEQLPAASSEANLLITYIDWLMAIP